MFCFIRGHWHKDFSLFFNIFCVFFFFFKPSIGSLKMMIDELFNLGNSWPWVNLRANLETSYSKDKTKQNKLKNLCDIEELLS